MAVRIKDHAGTTFITGMRAYASLAVVLIHAGGAGLRGSGLLGQAVVDLGAGGVTAFFVISGFSVATVYPRAGGYGRYLFFRFMRLAPLYYFWLGVYLLVLGRDNYWTEQFGLVPLGWDLFYHASFLHAFFLSTANSFMGVEWSLSVEMFWYLFLPALIRLGRPKRGLGLPVLAMLGYTAVAVVKAKARTDPGLLWQLSWNPLVYLLCFALGVWAHGVRGLVPAKDRQGGVWFALALLAAYILSNPLHGTFVTDRMLATSVITFLLLVFGDESVAVCRLLFLPRWILWLGTLSYGIYLTHNLAIHFIDPHFQGGPSIDFMRFVCVAGVSALMAYGTYVLIELPSQHFAKRFFPL